MQQHFDDPGCASILPVEQSSTPTTARGSRGEAVPQEHSLYICPYLRPLVKMAQAMLVRVNCHLFCSIGMITS